jgi:hypothetical protein
MKLDNKAVKLLLLSILILTFSSIALGQPDYEEVSESVVKVPEFAMEQIVRRVLVLSLKPGAIPKVVYLSNRLVKRSWLPYIKNINFKLVTDQEARKSEGVYFFTQPRLEQGVREIGFGYGHPDCEGTVETWRFRIYGQKVKLWRNGSFDMICSEPASILPVRSIN